MIKTKSRKSLLIHSIDKVSDLENRADLAFLQEKELQELHKKFFSLEDSIFHYFESILDISIKEVIRTLF